MTGVQTCALPIYGGSQRQEIVSCLDMFYQETGKRKVALSDTRSETLSVSAGYAWTDDPQSSISVLLSHADQALYTVKKGKRGCYAEYGA